MSFSALLEFVANVVTVITGLGAIYAYAYYRYDRRKRRKAVEDHLRVEKETGGDKGQRTVLHLMAKLGLTEAEILLAAFDSRKIKRGTSVDETGKANLLLLEWDDKS